MPVTPFHLGPALVVKALGPRWFSLGVFTVVQVAIDVESVVNIILGRYPVHAILHTVLGSLAVAAVLLLPARYWLPPVYGWFTRRPDLASLRSPRLGSPDPVDGSNYRGGLRCPLARRAGCADSPRRAPLALA